MKRSITRRGQARILFKIFRLLRLTAADVILCYGSNRTCLRTDIQHADHVRELSEEYTLRALCLWLVTTYGSSICTSAIQKDWQSARERLADLFAEFNEYPFANMVPDESFKDFNHRAQSLLQRCSPEMETLGWLYEHIHKFPMHIDAKGNVDIPTHIQEKDKRRLAGQFYTPASIVDYCFERAFEANEYKFMNALTSKDVEQRKPHDGCDSDDWQGAGKIFDPACGTGNFLLGAVRAIRKVSQSHSKDRVANNAPRCQSDDWHFETASQSYSKDWLIDNVCASVFGAELDGRAACLARISMVIALVDCWSERELSVLKSLLVKLRANIVNTDSLFAAPYTVDAGEVEIVITNPPYVSFGGRNQPKLSSGADRYLRDKFPESAEYKIRVHSIFQEIALRYAAAGGVATLLVPDGFLTGGYYKNLRQSLLKNSRLCSFAELPVDTVPGAVVGRWCVATYKKQLASTDDYPVRLFSLMNKAIPTEFSLPKSILVSRDQSRFRLVFNDIDMLLAGQIDRLQPLSSEFDGHTGIRALHGQNSIVSNRRKSHYWKKGIVSGISVLPHVVTWSGSYICIDARVLYNGGFDPSIVESPKMLLRQTGDCIVAAYDDQGLYHLNNIHSVTRLAHSTRSMSFLDGLMNSTFWLYIYRMKTREQGRALAQVDIDTLESMPLPQQNTRIENQIGDSIVLYRAAIRNAQDARAVQLSRAIDALVYRMYELDDETIRQIESGCGKLIDKVNTLPTSDELLTLLNHTESHEVICASPSL